MRDETVAVDISLLFDFGLLIASLGFFASAAQAIHLRMKEIAVKKLFGARGRDLMLTLGTPCFYIMLIAYMIACPPCDSFQIGKNLRLPGRYFLSALRRGYGRFFTDRCNNRLFTNQQGR